MLDPAPSLSAARAQATDATEVATENAPQAAQDDFDSPLDLVEEAKAQTEREEAFLLPLMWHGKPVEWTLLRKALYHRLMQHLAPVPHSLWGEDALAHVPDALLFLWLGDNKPEYIVALAGQPVALWMEVFKWAEENAPATEWTAAVALMTKAFEQDRLTEVRVREESGRSSLGKPPGQSR